MPPLAALVVVGLVFGLFLLREQPAEPAGPSGPTDATERPLLLRAAAVLEARNPAPVRIPRPDEWLFVRTARDWVEGRDEDNDGWTRADYKLGAQLDDGKVRTYDDEGVQWTAARVFPDLVEAYEFYADLPNNHAAVRRALYDLVDKHDLYKAMSICHEAGDCPGGKPEPWSRHGPVFLLVNAMLKETVPPPAVAAKLYRALAGVPGVEDAGSIIDLTGKKTAAVRWRPPAAAQPKGEAPSAYHILLDAETYEYRGDLFTGETYSFRDDGVTASDIILSAGFVDAVGEYPPITDRPEFPRILHKAADRLAARSSVATDKPRADQWHYRKVVRRRLDWPNEGHERWLRADFTSTAESVDGGPIETNRGGPDGIEAVVFTELADIDAFYDELPDEPLAALEVIYGKVGADDRVLDFTCHSPRACAQIREEGWARPAAAYELIQRLLYVSAPPPGVQATLFGALAAIPGVDARGTVADVTGAKAIAISWLPPVDIRGGLDLSRRVQILIDSETFRYRGYREFERDGWGEPELVESQAVLVAGLVDNVGERR